MFSWQGLLITIMFIYVVYLIAKDISENGIWGGYDKDTNEWE